MPRQPCGQKAGSGDSLKIIISIIGCAPLVGTLIGGSSALRFKGAQGEGVLDRNDRVIVKKG
jgi:hypothetical protein